MTERHLTFTEKGAGVRVDLDRLIRSRVLIQANSGGGKSWAIRQLLEETHGRVQHLVLDPEGEFATLRERYDYVLAAGKGGDVQAHPRTAALLCRRLVELGASAVLDIYDLGLVDRREFVRRFLTELMSLPRSLWRPILVVVDEAHQFCPEKGHGESPAAEAVINLCSQGRKRGFAAVLATQRISKLAKDAAAELNNKLIGRTSLDVDVKRAGDELGLDKDGRAGLKLLGQGEFFAFGPAISSEVLKVRTGAVRTSHPEAGALSAAPPPAPTKVQAMLQQLADLPKEAEARERSVEALERELRSARAELVHARKALPPPPPAPAPTPAVTAQDLAALKGVSEGIRQDLDRVEVHVADIMGKVDASVRAIEEAVRSVAAKVSAPPGPHRPIRVADATRVPTKDLPAFIRAHQRAPAPREGRSSLGSGERAVLTAIAQHDEGVTREQLTVLTGYKRSSRDTYLQRLRAAGLADQQGEMLLATAEGFAELGDGFRPLPTGDALREHWLQRLPEGERKVLEVVVAAYPSPIHRDAISEHTGYKRSSRDTYLQRLAARRLVNTKGGTVRASDQLFDGGLRDAAGA